MLMMVFIIVFLLLVIIGAPIAISVGLSTVFILLISNFPLEAAVGQMYSGLNSFLLSAIPLFIFMGGVMSYNKKGKKSLCELLFDFADSLISWVPAGLGASNVVASLFFGGISGSSTADAGGLGQVEVNGMVKHGYDKSYAAAISVASSTLAILIPPSIIMVVYAVSANQSVARCLLAGLGPGLLVAFSLLITNYIVAGKKKYIDTPKFNIFNVFKSFKKSFWIILTPVIVLGGIFTGLATITESAALGDIYIIVISLFVYKTVSINDLPKIIADTCLTTGVTLLLMATAFMAVYLFVVQGIPEMIAHILVPFISTPYIAILLLVFFMLLLGMFIDAMPALIMLVPIVSPIFELCNVDLVHAGAIMVSSLAIGLITPPVGICLFAIARVCKLSIESVVKALIPFYVSLIMAIVIIALYPPISLCIPNVILAWFNQ